MWCNIKVEGCKIIVVDNLLVMVECCCCYIDVFWVEMLVDVVEFDILDI